MGVLAAMYAAQGLPFGLFNIAIPSWMASQNYAAADIAWFIGIVTLPWSLKLFTAPLMDRWTYLPMGFRRPWIIAAQTGIVLSFIALSVVPEALIWLAAMGCITNAFAATQDVAVDGMAIDILPTEDRARANAFMFGGQFLGISLGSSAGGYAINYFGVAGMSLTSAALMLGVLSLAIALRERPGERLMPWTKGQPTPRSEQTESVWQAITRTLAIIFMPASVLLLIAQLGPRLAEGMIISYLPAHTVQNLGIANTTYNDYSTAGGVVAAITGVLISPWFDRFGAHNAHWWTVGFLVVTTLAIPYTIEALPMATIVVHWIGIHLTGITINATMMRFCHPAVAATQFAIYMAMANLNYSLGAFVYGELSGVLTGIEVLWFAGGLAAMALPAWYILLTRYWHTAPAQPE